ncbi:MAG: hypothetical protein ACREGI_03760, partial [Candidatus Levyibacteriota bacterium]
YGESAKEVWENVDKMKDTLLPIIKKRLCDAYPRLRIKSDVVQKELQERSVLILASSYTGFLHANLPEYPYGKHKEEGVLVSKGNNPPFHTDMFGVSSLDSQNLASGVELAVSIVRGNRKNKHIAEGSELFKSIDDFIATPVGILLQVRGLENVTEEEWGKITNTNWSDMLDMPWDSMSDSDFMEYLEEKIPDVSLSVGNALNKLRKRVGILYQMGEPTSEHLIEHDIVILPHIADESRRIRSIIPFLKLGFD